MLKIGFQHFWLVTRLEELWFYRFVQTYIDREVVLDNHNPDILFVSIFDFRLQTIQQYRQRCPQGKVVFFTGENMRNGYYGYDPLQWADLVLGFDYGDQPHYLRFPLWLIYAKFIPLPQPPGQPQYETDITPLLRTPDNEVIAAKQKFCAIVCGHDNYGTRAPLFDLLSSYRQVDSMGYWRHNVPVTTSRDKGEKLRFLQSYKFHLCPENTATPGYITEKLLHAFLADCIPIYYGGDDQVEAEIFNPAAMINVRHYPDRQALLAEIKRLDSDPVAYREMLQRPKLQPQGLEVIAQKMAELRQRLQRLHPRPLAP